MLTLEAEVAGGQCYCLAYNPSSHYYQTSAVNVGIYLLPSLGVKAFATDSALN